MRCAGYGAGGLRVQLDAGSRSGGCSSAAGQRDAALCALAAPAALQHSQATLAEAAMFSESSEALLYTPLASHRSSAACSAAF